MKYEYVNIKEAANMQLSIDFVKNLRILDPTVAAHRISGLLNSHKNEPSFVEIVAEFNSLVGYSTAEDNL